MTHAAAFSRIAILLHKKQESTSFFSENQQPGKLPSLPLPFENPFLCRQIWRHFIYNTGFSAWFCSVLNFVYIVTKSCCFVEVKKQEIRNNVVTVNNRQVHEPAA